MNKNTKFLIVGLGLIGGSYAKGLKKAGYEVGAIDVDLESINYALENKIVDSAYSEINEDYIKKFDIIVFALYPHVFINWIKENQKYIKSHALLTDVTGVKGAVVNEIQSILREDLEFAAAHPMAGREVSGVYNADETIFENANYIVTPTEKNTPEAIEKVKEIGQILKFKNIATLSVEEHDEMIGFLSQLTHCIAISLMTCNDNHKLALYTGDSFRDLTRIARINENMWCELFLLNKKELIKQMDLFIKEFEKLKLAIEQDDEATIKEMMKSSTLRRGYFDKNK